jgi:hypothetical protein
VAKIGKEDIFEVTTGNDNLHKISNDNGIRAAIFTHFSILQDPQIYSDISRWENPQSDIIF